MRPEPSLKWRRTGHWLPGIVIRDWPSLKYRGGHEDISRGQVPTLDTLKRLTRVLAEGKANMLELYIEHLFKWKKYPDIAPPEAISPEEGHELFDYAAGYGIEVHPMLQVLGHSYGILNLPQYQHYRVSPCEKAPWVMTFDIRKPETDRVRARPRERDLRGVPRQDTER